MTDEEKRAKNAEKSRKRRAELQYAAEINGFDTWSAMMTYIKNEAQAGRMAVMKPKIIEDYQNHHIEIAKE